MVIDSLEHTEIYEHINPLFKQAFDYLKSVDFSKAEVGKVELKDKDLFVIISDSDLRSEADAKLEVHNKYIDIQMPIDKTETFGWMGRADLKNGCESFDEEKDIQFFKDKSKTFFSLSPRNFAIFWPQDAHAPCIGEGMIRKIVVKIRVSK